MRGLLLLVLVTLGSVAWAQPQDTDSFTFPEYTPILVQHKDGARIQVLPWYSNKPPAFLDNIHMIRHADHTVWTAPPGYYILNSGTGEWRIVQITRGTDPPTDPDPPDPPTDPDVPSDRFDDIGKRVATWAAGLSQNNLLAAIYRDYAKQFKSGTKTVTMTFNAFNAEVREALAGDTSYQSFRDKYQADLQGRWPKTGMSRPDIHDYFNAIAVGLEAAQ